MIKTKQISYKVCEKASRKSLASKANNLSNIKAKTFKKKSSKKCRIKSENMCELSAYCDLLISA